MEKQRKINTLWTFLEWQETSSQVWWLSVQWRGRAKTRRQIYWSANTDATLLPVSIETWWHRFLTKQTLIQGRDSVLQVQASSSSSRPKNTKRNSGRCFSCGSNRKKYFTWKSNGSSVAEEEPQEWGRSSCSSMIFCWRTLITGTAEYVLHIVAIKLVWSEAWRRKWKIECFVRGCNYVS